MPDREKVIEGLEVCINRVPGKYDCNKCPYEIDGNYCEINLVKDALVLLKEQEIANLYKCPNCGTWVSAENVVRCKDCIRYYANGGNCDQVLADWFCADGERR